MHFSRRSLPRFWASEDRQISPANPLEMATRGPQVPVCERLSVVTAVAMRFVSLSFPVRQGDWGARGSLLPSHRVQTSRPDLQRAVVTKDAERFQFAMQSRALHADKSGGAGNV